MSSFLRKAFFLFTIFFSLSLISNAQSQSYYVVIGAFAKESNAKKFAGFARSRFFQATYEKHLTRKLFYVYVIKSTDRKEAIDQVLILQKEESFHDSWVFKGQLGAVNTVSQTPPVVTPVKPEGIVTDAKPTVSDSTRTSVDNSSEGVVSSDTTAAVVDPGVMDTVAVTEETADTEVYTVPTKKAKGKYFKFSIVSPDGQPINGNVHHVDLKRGRDLASYKSNAYSDVPRPANREEPMTVVCGIFGFKEVTQIIDYLNPAATTGASVDGNGIWTIPFTLERLKKGDISVMYDVSFFKDAVVMLPRSQEELDELVNMMKSNPNYKIEIHGHCNGKSKRKIIALGKQRNYFDIKGSDDQNGSAKELSKLRAEAVRDYLIEHGIDKRRMELMAWGGSNMLVSETSSSAKLNDRIEIEILAD